MGFWFDKEFDKEMERYERENGGYEIDDGPKDGRILVGALVGSCLVSFFLAYQLYQFFDVDIPFFPWF